jgi:hypothetical protein
MQLFFHFSMPQQKLRTNFNQRVSLIISLPVPVTHKEKAASGYRSYLAPARQKNLPQKPVIVLDIKRLKLKKLTGRLACFSCDVPSPRCTGHLKTSLLA